MIAGGVESMSRAPYVMAKADAAFSRAAKLEDTTLGWRFVNPLMKERYGVDSMAETGENVAEEFHISRADQDAFAYRSQQRAAAAIKSGAMADEIWPVTIPQRKGAAVVVDKDEHPRPETTLEGSGRVEADREADGNDHGGKRVGHQRRRVRVAAGVRGCGEEIRTNAEGASRGFGGGGCGAADHGDRSGSGVAQGAAAGGPGDCRHGRDRIE